MCLNIDIKNTFCVLRQTKKRKLLPFYSLMDTIRSILYSWERSLFNGRRNADNMKRKTVFQQVRVVFTSRCITIKTQDETSKIFCVVIIVVRTRDLDKVEEIKYLWNEVHKTHAEGIVERPINKRSRFMEAGDERLTMETRRRRQFEFSGHAME
jgi:hypothetical protein